jgi:uncharacterized SAM-binding protein YcdF (DUF218 family)
VAALVSPLGTALVLGVLAWCLLVLARRRFWRRVGAAVGLLALSWLWLWATPVASHALRSTLEAQAGPAAVDAVPAAGVAVQVGEAAVPAAGVMVVLGGGIGGTRGDVRPYPDLQQAADRVWHAARLYHAGKAARVVLSGGTTRQGEPAEAASMQAFLLDLGAPASAMLLEDRSLTTGENARLTAALLRPQGVDTVILVTSALHMRRARAEFELAGLKVIPAPTDFESLGRAVQARDWLPSAEALDGSGRAFKEWVGYWVLGE